MSWHPYASVYPSVKWVTDLWGGPFYCRHLWFEGSFHGPWVQARADISLNNHEVYSSSCVQPQHSHDNLSITELFPFPMFQCCFLASSCFPGHGCFWRFFADSELFPLTAQIFSQMFSISTEQQQLVPGQWESKEFAGVFSSWQISFR